MAYFAQLDENNYVTNVYSVNNSVIIENGIENETLGEIFLNTTLNTQLVYKRTSYNTVGGIYYDSITNTPSPDQSKAFRKNYAGSGYTYDAVRDAFIPPNPYPSWILDEFTCKWNPPIPHPDITSIPTPYRVYNRYIWNEDIINWELQSPFNSWLLNQNGYYISPINYPTDGNQYYWSEDILNWDLID